MENQTMMPLRDKAIRTAHSNILSSLHGVNRQYVTRDMILRLLMEHDAPRFYITPKMAERYIKGYYRSAPSVMQSRKIEMIRDLVQAYETCVRRHRHASKSALYRYTVESKAKSFYVSKHRMEEIVFNYTGRNGKTKQSETRSCDCGRVAREIGE